MCNGSHKHHTNTTQTPHKHLLIQADGESLGVQWITINENIDLYANHEWIIEKVCYHRDAYNPITENKKGVPCVWLTHEQ